MDITNELVKWYKSHHRDLPWRNTSDPYRIWLSEVILQQTRVNQGIGYYHKFVDEYPTVHELARADEDSVLKNWQGLGYYSRARNLHKAARILSEQHEGYFPKSSKELSELPGVGEYISAAVASFAFDEAVPVVDGNVFRVLSRYFGVDEPIDTTRGKKKFRELANEVLNRKEPATFNQAIMEFGAMQCTPVNPDCASCPLQTGCVAYAENRVGELPVKARKTRQKQVFFYYLVLFDSEGLWVNKRTTEGIWKNLYDFPVVESSKKLDPEMAIGKFRRTELPGETFISRVSEKYSHVLSHRKIEAVFIEAQNASGFERDSLYLKCKWTELPQLAVPRLIHRFLEDRGWIER